MSCAPGLAEAESSGDYRTTKVSGRKTGISESGLAVQSHLVAVGTPIARHPPHRSVRAR
jgi:hypothetical protein